MQRISMILATLTAALSLTACADGPTTLEVERKAQPPSINSCDDGVEACQGDTRCESCLIEGECASGPNPVWTGTACVCTDNNPANCVYEFCCALGYEWNPSACRCLPHGGGDEDAQ